MRWRNFRAGQEPIIIAPVHRDGKDFSEAIREKMKGAGMLAREDQEITRLESCDLSEVQKADPINYEVGQVVECHACSSPGRWALWLSQVQKSSSSTTISAITGQRHSNRMGKISSQ